MDNPWSAERLNECSAAAIATLIENIDHLEEIDIWTSGAATAEPSRTHLHAKMTFNDKGTEKLYYTLTPRDVLAAGDSARDFYEWVIMHMFKHLVMWQYHSKLKK